MINICRTSRLGGRTLSFVGALLMFLVGGCVTCLDCGNCKGKDKGGPGDCRMTGVLTGTPCTSGFACRAGSTCTGGTCVTVNEGGVCHCECQ
jgi:hypothetical protein